MKAGGLINHQHRRGCVMATRATTAACRCPRKICRRAPAVPWPGHREGRRKRPQGPVATKRQHGLGSSMAHARAQVVRPQLPLNKKGCLQNHTKAAGAGSTIAQLAMSIAHRAGIPPFLRLVQAGRAGASRWFYHAGGPTKGQTFAHQARSGKTQVAQDRIIGA